MLHLKLSEIDIWRAARQMIELYGLDAGWRAGLCADQLLEDGDVDAFHVWVRITNAIKELLKAEPSDPGMTH
jgi:hypothetical protein